MKKVYKYLFLISLFAFVSCNNNTTSDVNTSSEDIISNDISSSIDDVLGNNEYRVQVVYPNGDICNSEGMYAQWCSDSMCYLPIKFDENGYAKTKIESDDVNAEYSVHLGNIPEGYTYNANKYKTSNENNDIIISLAELSSFINGDGTNDYDVNDTTKGPYIVSNNVYNFNITSEDEEVYFGFKAPSAGKYIIEAWAYDSSGVTTELNYYGNDLLNIPSEPISVITTGGLNGNFAHELNVDSNDETYIFSIKAIGERIYPIAIPVSISEVK